MVEHYTLLLNNSYIMMISNKFKLYYLKRRINVQAFEAGSEIIVVVSYLKLDVAGWRLVALLYRAQPTGYVGL